MDAAGNQVDTEYATLMAELGEQPGGYASGYLGVPGYAGPPKNERGEKIPPWRDPSVWNAPGPGRSQHDSLPDSSYAEGGWTAVGYDYGWGTDGGQAGAEGQRDYSAEWAAYYAAQAAQQQQMQESGGQGVRDYSKEWEEYYRQQALAQQQQ